MAPRFILLPAVALALLAAAAPAQAATLDRGVLRVEGTAAADEVTIRADGRHVLVGDEAFRRSAVRAIDVRTGDGDDHVTLGKGLPRAEVEGGEGLDALRLEDRCARVRARGERVRVGDVDTGTVERLELAPRTLTVDDLTGTSVNDIEAETDGRVVLRGTPASDFTDLFGQPGDVFAFGLPATVRVLGDAEIEVRGEEGADRMSSSSAAPAVLDGGAGDDDLSGGPGAERLYGGDGIDFVEGGGGDDRADLGPGELDIFAWDPGDGSDRVEGRRGNDVLLFRGSAEPEFFSLTPRRLTRDVGGIAMDFDGVEKVEVGLRGGADRLDVADLTHGDVDWVVAELASGIPGQSLDGAADAVTVQGRGRPAAVADTLGGVRVTGLPALLDVLRPEGALDTLTLAQVGAVDTSGLTPGTIGFAMAP